MKTRVFLLAVLGLSRVLSANANSSDDVEQLLSLSLEDLMATKVTISTNTKQALSKAPSVVSVITAEDIKATGATNFTDLLQSIPGIYVRPNLFAARPLVTFRGADGTQTLLMVNGQAIRDLVWDPGIFWKGLPTSMIERIEIIRGPGSALFGSDASAGVINIITKTAADIGQSEAGARTGSFGMREGWVQHGGNLNGFDFGLTAELSHTDGYNPFIPRDGQTALDKRYGTAVSFAPGYANYGYDNEDFRFSLGRDNWRLLADYVRQSNVGIGLTGAAVLDPLTRGDYSRFDVQLRYDKEQIAKDWSLNAELHYYQLEYTSGDGFQENPPGFTNATGNYPAGFINEMRSAERGFGYEASGLYAGLRAHAIRLGGGYNAENLYFVQQFINAGIGPNGTPLPAGGPLVDVSNSPYVFAPEKNRQIGYAFIQDVWTFADDWDLTAGARYDHYSDFGGTLNPRLALVWQSTDRLVTKLMYGQAFIAPTFLQLYALTAANKPNPNLKPEQSQTWDLSFSYLASKDLKLGIDFYQFAQQNLIVVDASTQFQNMGNSESRGVELEATWQALKTLRISGNLSSRDDVTNPYNPVPKQKAYLRTDWAFAPNWSWDVQANWIGKHALAPGDARAQIGAYTLLDTTVRYSLSRAWELAASIRNLLDVDARELSSSSIPNNLPLPGRNLYAEARFKF
ncbi:MAG: TonB-dependent receptor [Rhodocyclaceae bacterium]|nr:TonB-dependent receptor [Rhodocyclaceae bacterium]